MDIWHRCVDGQSGEKRAALKPGTRERLMGISTATVTMRLSKRGLRYCFILSARALQPNDCHFVAEACTLRFIPMKEDLSKVEMLSDTKYPPR